MNFELILKHSVDIAIIILAIGWAVGHIIEKSKEEYEPTIKEESENNNESN